MDLRKIKKLLELIEASSIAEIEIHAGEESVRITRIGATAQTVTQAPPPSVQAPTPTSTAPAVVEAEAAEPRFGARRQTVR